MTISLAANGASRLVLEAEGIRPSCGILFAGVGRSQRE